MAPVLITAKPTAETNVVKRMIVFSLSSEVNASSLDADAQASSAPL
jgi:hypothetical protein